jgi:hypothetical protein
MLIEKQENGWSFTDESHASTLSNFSVTSASTSQIQISWGDSTTSTTPSGTPVSHNYTL